MARGEQQRGGGDRRDRRDRNKPEERGEDWAFSASKVARIML